MCGAVHAKHREVLMLCSAGAGAELVLYGALLLLLGVVVRFGLVQC